MEINTFARDTWRNGLGALYMPDAGTGSTTWADYSGNGNTATLTGTASFTTAGGRRALSVGSAGANITDHASLNVGGGNLTIAAWVYMTTAPSSGDDWSGYVFGDESGSDMTAQLRIGPTGSSSVRLWPHLVCRIGGSYYYINSESDISLNAWVFIAATTDGSSFRIYYNGNLTNTASVPYSPQNYNNAWAIGRLPGGSNRLFRGQIGMVAFWPQRCLDTNEIKGLYEATK